MLNHVWLDYIVMENKEIKKKFFLVSNVPRGGGTLDTHVGHVGPHSLGWEKNSQKKIFFIEQVTIKIQNDYVKHPYQYSIYLTLYPP